MRDIYFGESSIDINFCDLSTHYYRTKDGAIPDLTGSQVSVVLESLTPTIFNDLNLTLSIIADGSINIYWTYSDLTGVKVPFEVPQEIINIDRSKLGGDSLD